MKNCPACERKFDGILDYPLIIIKKVERGETGALEKLIAVDGSGIQYRDPHPNFSETNLDEVPESLRSHVIIQKIAPEGLQKLFTGTPKSFVGSVEFEGWQYIRKEEPVFAEKGPVVPPNADRFESRFFPPVVGANWVYKRFKQAQPYVEAHIVALEGLVGREVSRADFASMLDALCCENPVMYLQDRSALGEWSRNYFIKIVNSGESDYAETKRIRISREVVKEGVDATKLREQPHVVGPGQANLDLCVSLGGTHGEYKTVATLAVIDYEGRPLTVEEQIQRGKNG